MNDEIGKIDKSEFTEVVDVWEASVRATHHFLQEKDIEHFKRLILNQYLNAVELRCVRDDNRKILGFFGVAEQKLEMLFLHPKARGKGFGKKLLQYAIEEFDVITVDVNEENEQAIGFYENFGFKTIARSELDSSGKPYPILHMKLLCNPE